MDAPLICTVEDCRALRRSNPKGRCNYHRRMEAQGLPLVAKTGRRKSTEPSPGCSFDGCNKAVYARQLCRQHDAQRRAGKTLRPLGDPATKSASAKAYWQGLSEEGRAARVGPLRESKPYPRSDAWRRAMSTDRRAAWGRGENRPRDPRVCRSCGETYMPNSGPQVYCTKECSKRERRLLVYDLTWLTYSQMLAEQGGVCALCGQGPRGYSASADQILHVDHCHATGKPRALLCSTCNTAIGRFGDDPARLRAAAAYLDRYL